MVAVDDGSIDGSAALIEQWGAQSGVAVTLLQPGRVGLATALQLGLEAARGAYVARMDGDDVMAPQRLAKQAAFLDANSHIDVVATQARIVPEAARNPGLDRYMAWQNGCLTPEQIAREIYWESPIAHPTTMCRRRVVLAHGGYREGDFPEDYELWLRLIHAGVKLAKLPEVLLDWRDSPTRFSRADPHCARAAFDRVRADYLARDARITGARPVAVWGAGRRTRRRLDGLWARGVASVAWIDIDARKIGNRIQGAPVVAPEWLRDTAPHPFVLAAVASHGARELIEADLSDMGYQPGEDYLMVG
ncbi:putative glycosyl transferase family 2 protein [Magnetofaba australis IT-1]|uniref:Putative glycosyl transferase family 2 protein n=2 Tax=Magnetofaba TaxID=1472292 RepID=A0A1Y2K5D3_9PROT|nr:putative glycosyl transferase family 2 protein [Magnetofaba australis IT-1]